MDSGAFFWVLCLVGVGCLVSGQSNSDIARVQYPSSFLFNGPPTACPPQPKKLILTISSQYVVVYCNSTTGQSTGIFIGNNYKFGDIMYIAQPYSSVCKPKATDCFNNAALGPSSPLASFDYSEYVFVSENATSDVDSVVHSNYSPFADIQVTQCYAVVGIERFTQTVSSNYVTFCVVVQSNQHVQNPFVPAGAAAIVQPIPAASCPALL